MAAKELASIQTKVLSFFSLMDRHLPDWKKVVTGEITAPAARGNLVVGHTAFFESLAYLGKAFTFDLDISALIRLQELRRRMVRPCVVGMRMIKSVTGVKSTAVVLLKVAGQELPADITKVDQRVLA